MGDAPGKRPGNVRHFPIVETYSQDEMPTLEPAVIERLLGFRYHDPFEVLGRHLNGERETIRVLLNDAQAVWIEHGPELSPVGDSGLFEWHGAAGQTSPHYTVGWRGRADDCHAYIDPYTFAPQLPESALSSFAAGRHYRAYELLGARAHVVDGVEGCLFSVWAPNAERIGVVGSFNQWDGRRHPMRIRGSSGVWELFIPEVERGAAYKFEIRPRDSERTFLKTDPFANYAELRPNTASIYTPGEEFGWSDEQWLAGRAQTNWPEQPISIYEVHLGSWRNDDDTPNTFPNYRTLGVSLVEYVKTLGFTHIELLPVTEHPLDASWGYQTTGYFAPTSRYGTPDEFRQFVNTCHRHGLGVLMDWAPAHFPKDAHGLAQFDGHPLYEHQDPRNAEQRDWGTLMFDFGRPEVKSFLISSALYWFDEFHIDGLRVDAVAAMLYLDYSKNTGEWLPNRYGGNENLEAVELLRELNDVVHREYEGVLTIAEESTSWPQVTGPTGLGGLGFTMKWNLGWMNDTLEYFHHEPIHRSYHHDKLTFGLTYNFSENFLLPLSHDEVVHLKRSLLSKMPGDEWQRFANLRLLYTYLWTYPGKKLLFMGGEFGQSGEWDHERQLQWPDVDDVSRTGLQHLVADLNALYRAQTDLHTGDFESDGFRWIDCHDPAQSVVSFERVGPHGTLIVALNFTPVVRHNYRLGVSNAGTYTEILNSDAAVYGGSNVGNQGAVVSNDVAWMSRPFSLSITLPPLAGLVFKAHSSS
jgi:1,4-alpha-glucan branching enzyme